MCCHIHKTPFDRELEKQEDEMPKKQMDLLGIEENYYESRKLDISKDKDLDNIKENQDEASLKLKDELNFKMNIPINAVDYSSEPIKIFDNRLEKLAEEKELKKKAGDIYKKEKSIEESAEKLIGEKATEITQEVAVIKKSAEKEVKDTEEKVRESITQKEKSIEETAEKQRKDIEEKVTETTQKGELVKESAEKEVNAIEKKTSETK